MLSRLNICSKESVVRQYDHEVQGTSVIKPLIGDVEQFASLEAFLESPGVLAEAFPDLYGRLSAYLHLDPRQWSARLNEATAS